MAQNIQNCINRCDEKINWKIEEKSHEFLRKLNLFIRDYQGQLPNLRDIFRREAIDWLLTESITTIVPNMNPDQFVDFVINTGYKDEPDLSEDGKPILRRTTALHRAAKRGGFDTDIVVHKLFRIYDSFDVNYVDEDGSTHFHIACEQHGCLDVVKKFLEHGVDPNCLVPETSDSPLHLALENNNKEVSKLLLRNGANLILANSKGKTPLHLISEIDVDGGLTEMFFEICRDRRQTVEIDARDNEGNTPLHIALDYSHKKVAESLLRRGASPNATNAEGSTPLHVICKKEEERPCNDGMTEQFFRVNDAMQQTLQVDARDKMGQTPLQWAVASFKPAVIDVLLDRGADLSSFVMPTSFKTGWDKSNVLEFNLSLASGILAVVERLEKRGYELSRNDTLMIMTLFCNHELFEKSTDLDECWFDEEEFAVEAKKIIAKRRDDDDEEEAKETEKLLESLSLYDLIRLRPEEAAKLLTYEDYFYLANSAKIWDLPEEGPAIEACARCLCEKVSWGFFRRWALDSLLELTKYQLPILCCDMIIEQLMNEDLSNIFLVAASHNL